MNVTDMLLTARMLSGISDTTVSQVHLKRLRLGSMVKVLRLINQCIIRQITSDAINMNIQVEKKDIKKIGNTAFNEDGFLAIVCDGDTSNIEEILLRSILMCFGDDYKVIKTEDYRWENDEGEVVYEILYVTNLPYELFEKII